MDRGDGGKLRPDLLCFSCLFVWHGTCGKTEQVSVVLEWSGTQLYRALVGFAFIFVDLYIFSFSFVLLVFMSSLQFNVALFAYLR